MDRNQRCVVAFSLLFPALAMAQKSVCDQSLDELIQHATRAADGAVPGGSRDACERC